MATDLAELRMYFQNIACSSRDEQGKNVYQSGDAPVICSPLYTRLPELIKNISTHHPDVVVLYEAGRTSMSHTWIEMAAEIERQTDLTFVALLHANGSATPFAHALFVNRKYAHFAGCSNIPTFKGTFDAHATVINIKQVLNGKVLDDRIVTIGAMHMPVTVEGRTTATKWLVENHKLAQFWVGDFNTYPDDIGPWMIEQLEATGMRHAECNLDYTFRGFDYDVIDVPIEKQHTLHPLAEIIERTETHVRARPVSVLDHVFVNEGVNTFVVFLPLTPASDHCAILMTAQF